MPRRRPTDRALRSLAPGRGRYRLVRSGQATLLLVGVIVLVVVTKDLTGTINRAFSENAPWGMGKPRAEAPPVGWQGAGAVQSGYSKFQTRTLKGNVKENLASPSTFEVLDESTRYSM